MKEIEVLKKESIEIFELLSIGVFYKKINGEYLYCNKAFADIVGFPKSKLIGMKLDNYLKSGDLDVNAKYDKLLLKSKKSVEYSFELKDFKHKNAFRFFKVTKSLVKDDKGKVVGILGTLQNITEERTDQEKLNWFKEGFESSSNSMVLVSYATKQPRIVQVNDSFCKIYGYKQAEVLGKNPSSIRSDKTDMDVYKDMWKSILDPRIAMWSAEIVNKRKDGSLVDVILTINSIFDEKGKLKSFVAHHTDISESKKLQKKLEVKLSELEEFNNLVVNRELKMIELKKEIKEFERKRKK